MLTQQAVGAYTGKTHADIRVMLKERVMHACTIVHVGNPITVSRPPLHTKTG